MKKQKLSFNDFEAVETKELLEIKGGLKIDSSLIFGYGRGGGGGGGFTGSYTQDMLLACAQNDDCCQSTVTNRIYELGNTMIPSRTDDSGNPTSYDYLVSDDFLTTIGNEAYAVCRGYSVPGW